MPVERQIRVTFPGLRPPQGSCHENPRSCAGALWEGQHGSLCRGGGSLPEPLPGRYPPRYGAWQDAGEGRDRGRHLGPAFPVLAPLLGISRLLPPPQRAGEERRRRGWGGGERRAVYGEMPVKRTIRVASPRLRPARALATRTPAPAPTSTPATPHRNPRPASTPANPRKIHTSYSHILMRWFYARSATLPEGGR